MAGLGVAARWAALRRAAARLTGTAVDAQPWLRWLGSAWLGSARAPPPNAGALPCWTSTRNPLPLAIPRTDLAHKEWGYVFSLLACSGVIKLPQACVAAL